VNPAASAEFEDDLYAYNLRRALAVVSAALDEYDESAIPAELREFVLMREYTRANERYADYLGEPRNADTAAEQSAGVSNLTGLMGDFARAKLVEDFSRDYLAANSYTAYHERSPRIKGRRGIADYIDDVLRGSQYRARSCSGRPRACSTSCYRRWNISDCRRPHSGGNYETVNEQDYAAEFQNADRDRDGRGLHERATRVIAYRGDTRRSPGGLRTDF
jgi:hypothetical protein